MSEEKDKKANGEPGLPSDDHALWEWTSKYSKGAWKNIWGETIYLLILLALSLLALALHMSGKLYCWHIQTLVLPDNAIDSFVFHRGAYCIIMGFLGGTTYDIKILYKSVAGGHWHVDRRIWRIATPWVSMALTIVVASMMTAKVFSSASVFMAIVIGFFAGYFSESAIGKLYAVAQVLFGG